MEILRTFCLAAIAATSPFQPSARPEVVLVTSVVDGHTIEVAGVGRVRLLGIDAPRAGNGVVDASPFGREAKSRLEGMVIRRFVRLEFEPGGGRRAYVLLEDGTLVNAVLVREGLAKASTAATRRRDELKRAEQDAKAMRRGIWGARKLE